jgi:hypothetical protein
MNLPDFFQAKFRDYIGKKICYIGSGRSLHADRIAFRKLLADKLELHVLIKEQILYYPSVITKNNVSFMDIAGIFLRISLYDLLGCGDANLVKRKYLNDALKEVNLLLVLNKGDDRALASSQGVMYFAKKYLRLMFSGDDVNRRQMAVLRMF